MAAPYQKLPPLHTSATPRPISGIGRSQRDNWGLRPRAWAPQEPDHVVLGSTTFLGRWS